MKFDIARQPLVPAILTLMVLAASAMYWVDLPPAAAETRSSTDGLTILMPGALFADFQSDYPVWSRLIAGFLIFFTGMCTARVAIRFNLYSVSTCISVPLYAIIACGLGTGDDYLASFFASALLALSVKNFCLSYSNGYKFDPIFRASLYLGALIILYIQALPLLLLLPFTVLLFRRTLRETIVALTGLLLPLLLLCYANWGAGGIFTAPLVQLGRDFITGVPLHLFISLPISTLALLGAIFLLTLFAVIFFLTHIYSAGSKPRFIILYNIGVLLLTLPLGCGPAATTGSFALLAIPAAILLPVFFVRIRRSIGLVIYLLLLVATVSKIFLQYYI